MYLWFRRFANPGLLEPGHCVRPVQEDLGMLLESHPYPVITRQPGFLPADSMHRTFQNPMFIHKE